MFDLMAARLPSISHGRGFRFWGEINSYGKDE